MANTFISIREEESRVLLFVALLLEPVNWTGITLRSRSNNGYLPIHTTPANKLPTVFLLKFREQTIAWARGIILSFFSLSLPFPPPSPRNSQKKFNRSVPLHRRNLKLQSGGVSGEKTMPKRKKKGKTNVARLERSGDRLRLRFLPAICHCTLLTALGIDKCRRRAASISLSLTLSPAFRENALEPRVIAAIKRKDACDSW